MRLSVARPGFSPDEPFLAVTRRETLLPAYTLVTIVLGAVALLGVTLLVQVSSGIALQGVGADAALPAGIALWTLFGLAGAARIVREPSGHGVLTLHLPFIAAAMLLGGPVAGGWVAMLASFERRELEEVPWYGVLANHTSLALAAVAGGAVLLGVEGVAGLVVGAGNPAVAVIAAGAGIVALTAVSVGLAAGVIVLRDGLALRETLRVFDRAFRSTAVGETLFGCLLAVVYLQVGWWAPVLAVAAVLALVRSTLTSEIIDRDELTGLLSRAAFANRTAEAADRARRGLEGAAYLFIDLDGFKAVNDEARDHHIGDQVLTEVGLRLRQAIRVTDAAGRRGGDEFMVLFTGVRDAATAEWLAARVHRAIIAPYRTDAGEIVVGASIGVAMIEVGRRDFEPDIRQAADAAMYAAKAAGGGVVVRHEPVPG